MKHDYSTNYETLKLIRWFVSKRGYSPTYQEIAELRGMSEAAIRKHVRYLVGSGYLHKPHPRTWRSIRLLEAA